MKIPGYMLLFCCDDCSLLCAAKLCATIEVAGATGVDGSELKWALNRCAARKLAKACAIQS